LDFLFSGAVQIFWDNKDFPFCPYLAAAIGINDDFVGRPSLLRKQGTRLSKQGVEWQILCVISIPKV